ncbi:response regulator transcription factor [Aeromicrobium chenweiae]|uniref:DNA-binding response regulator n=1 Tax=Aeromicrobium chenweiae TaxID=2079793 RepID=A0A2S0WNC2_9ACTN|nr:response regulator transcription factor [Aeromicrobium chenweiae]AWB92754.1 DNA-binding response regulator [Aeromicrobium chenweiae]TGN33746.1 response regulator transcription factor [Aeromicrobium chenweiae]
MSRILIVEDEDRISSFLAKGLKAEGFTPTVVTDGVTGLDYALTGEFDLMVLDIGLPGLDGFRILERVSADRPTLPVIVLTARDSVTDTVAALEGGAADYMSKPFKFGELLARVRLRLRSPGDAAPQEDLSVGPVRIDLRRRRAYVGEREVELSARELTLAEVLIRNRGLVLSREQLLSQVWGYDFDPGSNVVDVYIGYLRKKLGARLITTVRGLGYRVD